MQIILKNYSDCQRITNQNSAQNNNNKKNPKPVTQIEA